MSIVQNSFIRIALSILILIVLGHAKDEYHFKHISLEQGLSQSAVYSIYQDSQGFMWFGTEDGLNRYDGNRIKIYSHDPADFTSLSNNTIYAILEDSNGFLWFGTHGGGLCKYDRSRDQFTTYRSTPLDSTSLSTDYVFAIVEDPFHPGVLWVGTSRGFNIYDPEIDGFTTNMIDYEVSMDLIDYGIYTLFLDHQQTLWIGTDYGLASLDLEHGSFHHYVYSPDQPEGLSRNVIYAVHEDMNNLLWVATGRGLNSFDRQSGTFGHYPSDPKNPESISNDLVYSIYTDYSGYTWFGTYKGLNKYDPRTQRFSRIFTNPINVGSISSDYILSLYSDRSQVLWIGTSSGGVNLHDLKHRKFSHQKSDPGNPNSMSSNQVMAIYKDSSNMVWIGTTDKGLDTYNPMTDQFTHFQHDPDNPYSLSDNSIAFLFEDTRGDLWVGSSGGLNKFSRSTGQFTRYVNDPENPQTLSDNNAFSMVQATEDVYWIGTFGGGLNRYNARDNIFTTFEADPGNPNSLSDNNIYCLFLDQQGVLWIGTDNGMDKFDESSGEFHHFKHVLDDTRSLSNNAVYCILEDEGGDLWIGTGGGGLNKYDRKTGLFTSFTKRDGLPNDVVYAIVAGQDGAFWLSTNLGLSRFDLKTESFTNYTVHDGLQSNEFNGGAFFGADDGEIFFGGLNGYNSFYPSDVVDNPHTPEIVITDLQILNESVIPGEGSPLSESIITAKQIDLNYNDDVISFEFSALEYTASDKNQYAFKMEGFDSDWNYSGKRRFVTYTNLDPGTYTFRVKGSNNDGQWNEVGTSIEVIIHPPFWQTIWFRLSGFIIFLATIVGIVKLRIAAIESRRNVLEALVLERTEELEVKKEELEKSLHEISSINTHLQHEISERRLTEKELKNSERKYRDLFEKSDDAVLIISNGKFIDCNAAAIRLLRYNDKEDLLETRPAELSPEFQSDGRSSVKKADEMMDIVLKQGSHRFVWEHKKADGDIFPVEVLLTLIHTSDKETIIHTIWRDITERVRAEAERQVLERQLRQASKLEAVGTMVGGISHELNNVLQTLFLYGGMLQEDISEDAETYTHLQNMLDAADRARDIVKQILTFSQNTTLHMTPRVLHEILQDAISLESLSLPPDVEVHQDIETTEYLVLCDKTQIHQIMTNLFNNAKHALEGKGGKISVCLRHVFESIHKRTPQIEALELTVTDTGHGMDKKTLEKVFDPFFTTKDIGMGTGLGLSVIHGLVEAMQGQIAVTSKVGKGTTVKILFPVTTESVVQVNKEPKAPIEEKRQSMLLVDDDDSIRISLKRSLERKGYAIEVAVDGKQGYALFSTNPDKYDIIVTDLSMPIMSGSELTKKIRASGSHIPIILSTGHLEASDRQEYLDMGINVCIKKPWTVNELLALIRELGD